MRIQDPLLPGQHRSEIKPRFWNWSNRSEIKSDMDNTVSFSPKNKLKVKKQQPKPKIKRRIMRQIDLSGKYSPVPDLEKANNEALAEWYNKHSGSSIVLDKKSKRETLVKKVSELKHAMDELAARANAEPGTSKKDSMKKTTKTKAPKGKAKTAGKNGEAKSTKNAQRLAMTIKVTTKECPWKLPKSHGAKCFNVVSGLKNPTVQQAIDAGCRWKDIKWGAEELKCFKLVS